MKTVTHVCWFTHLNTCIGIIIVENAMKEKRAYIGTAIGFVEDSDMQMIAEYGSKFSLEAAEILMKDKGLKVNYSFK
jgi:hypothetical protein